jgi:hypothetical protein
MTPLRVYNTATRRVEPFVSRYFEGCG